MAGEADSVASWFQEAFGRGGGGGYATVQGNGTAATQRTVLDVVAGAGVTVTVADDGASSPPRTKATIAASGSGGATLVGPYTTAGPTTIVRTSAWTRLKVGTAANAVGLKLDAASFVEGDQVDFIDIDRSFGVHALTVNGDGRNLEDPFNQSTAPGPTYATPPGFEGLFLSFVLVKNSANVLFWKAMSQG
jgi:hypothetical protein